jgi:anti-sigma factor RsiW
MTPTDPRLLVHAYVDGELDPAHALEVERQLADDPALAVERERVEALRRVIAEQLPREGAPPGLAQRIEAAVGLRSAPAPARASSRPSWRALAASVAVAAFLGSGATWLALSPGSPDADMVVANHVRALMATHPVDVGSSDQHTVKPWFNGKLDASPPVVDLASQGFPLIGGRLDYIHNHVVGALVFKHDQHVINLFIWPVADADDSGPASATREGFNLLHWTCSGMTFWAVSDVNSAALRRFQAEYDRQTSGSSQS